MTIFRKRFLFLLVFLTAVSGTSASYAADPARDEVLRILEEKRQSYNKQYQENIKYLENELGPALAGLAQTEKEFLVLKYDIQRLGELGSTELQLSLRDVKERLEFGRLRLIFLAQKIAKANQNESGDFEKLQTRLELANGFWIKLNNKFLFFKSLIKKEELTLSPEPVAPELNEAEMKKSFLGKAKTILHLAKAAKLAKSYPNWIWSKMKFQNLLKEGDVIPVGFDEWQKLTSQLDTFSVDPIVAQKKLLSRWEKYYCPKNLTRDQKRHFRRQYASFKAEISPTLAHFEVMESVVRKLGYKCMRPHSKEDERIPNYVFDPSDNGDGGSSSAFEDDSEHNFRPWVDGYGSDRFGDRDSRDYGDPWEVGAFIEGATITIPYPDESQFICPGCEITGRSTPAKPDRPQIILPPVLGPKGEVADDSDPFTLQGSREDIRSSLTDFSRDTSGIDPEISARSRDFAEEMRRGEEMVSLRTNSLKSKYGEESPFEASTSKAPTSLIQGGKTSEPSIGVAGLDAEISNKQALVSSLIETLQSKPLKDPVEQAKAERALLAAQMLIDAAREDAKYSSESAKALLDMAQEICNMVGPDILRMGVGFIPMVGDGADIVEAVTGKDIATGETLSSGQRFLAVVSVVAGNRALYEGVFKGFNKIIVEGIESFEKVVVLGRRYGKDVNLDPRYAKWTEKVWTDGEKVLDYVTTKTETYFRVFGGKSGKERSFVLGVDPRNYSKSDLRKMLAIPESNTMEYIVEVKVPPKTRMRAGVAAQNWFGEGGLFQYEILDEVDKVGIKWGDSIIWP